MRSSIDHKILQLSVPETIRNYSLRRQHRCRVCLRLIRLKSVWFLTRYTLHHKSRHLQYFEPSDYVARLQPLKAYPAAGYTDLIENGYR